MDIDVKCAFSKWLKSEMNLDDLLYELDEESKAVWYTAAQECDNLKGFHLKVIDVTINDIYVGFGYMGDDGMMFCLLSKQFRYITKWTNLF